MQLMQGEVQEEFTVGQVTKESFKYLGISTEVRKDGGFQQHQKDYIEKLKEAEITAKNIKEDKKIFRKCSVDRIEITLMR